jgi:hypothetical protein
MDPLPDSLIRGTDPRIRIRTKMSRIRNTAPRETISLISFPSWSGEMDVGWGATTSLILFLQQLSASAPTPPWAQPRLSHPVKRGQPHRGLGSGAERSLDLELLWLRITAQEKQFFYICHLASVSKSCFFNFEAWLG